MQEVDHIVMAVKDLDATAARFRDEFGLDTLAATFPGFEGTGGRHLLFIPVGRNQYLEVMSLEEDRGGWNPTGEGWAVWSLRSDDLDGHAKKLGLPVIRPEVPAGFDAPATVDEIAHVGMEESQLSPEGTVPFFIRRPEHLLESFDWYRTPQHKQEPDGVASITVSGDAEKLERWVGEHTDEIRIVNGPPRITSVAVRLLNGDLLEIG